MADANSTTNPSGPNTCRAAAVTMAYNESVMLPIWRHYYSGQVGEDNLFILDDGSTDGSTDGIPNVIRLPRSEMDETRRAAVVSNFCAALLMRYDAVICTDCDELVVADPRKYEGLPDYVARRTFDYATCIGLNVLHILTQEPPLKPSAPILRQRGYAMYRSSSCKPSVTRVPLAWSPGFHSCDRPPAPDPDLFLFHLARMDFGLASKRHAILSDIPWSAAAIAQNHGAHWRYDTERFVREGFLDHLHALKNGLRPFDFTEETTELWYRTTKTSTGYSIPMDIMRLVEIPEAMRDAF
jgi:hypothetical protein